MIIVLKDADFSANNIGNVSLPQKTISSITIEGANALESLSSTYKAIASYSDGSTSDVTDMATWSANIGTINKGVLTLPSDTTSATVTVTATYEDTIGTITITVTIPNEGGNSGGSTDTPSTPLLQTIRFDDASKYTSGKYWNLTNGIAAMLSSATKTAYNDLIEVSGEIKITMSGIAPNASGAAFSLYKDDGSGALTGDVARVDFGTKSWHAVMQDNGDYVYTNANASGSIQKIGLYVGETEDYPLSGVIITVESKGVA